MTLTAQDIEIAVACHFGYRQNLVVPNVSWGWGLRHEADMIVLRPSGYADEVEIKVSAADITRDRKKQYSHWDSVLIARVWFAVPEALADHPDIPEAAGIIGVARVNRKTWTDTVVTVHRPARLRDKATRKKVTDAQRIKLAELGAMRIWDLKAALAAKRKKRP